MKIMLRFTRDVILVDKSRVIQVLNKLTETNANQETFEEIKIYLKL